MRCQVFKSLIFIFTCQLSLFCQAEEIPGQSVKSQPYDTQLWNILSPDKAKESGLELMALPYGLHRLSPHNKQGPLIILVHGFKSRGYEWVYAAKKLYMRGEVYFYRWNWEQCPQEGALGLHKALKALLVQRTQRSLEVFGHSYGGVISSVLATLMSVKQEFDIHIIAAPLAGYKSLESACSPSIKALLAPLTKTKDIRPRLIQWKTVHKLDGAFKHLDDDPQDVTWPHIIHHLPRTYKGHRLGHNWSINAVVDQVLARP